MLGMFITSYYFLYLFKVILALLGETADLAPNARIPKGERFLKAAALVGDNRRALWGSAGASADAGVVDSAAESAAAGAGAAAASCFSATAAAAAAASASAIATLLSPNGSGWTPNGANGNRVM